MKDVEDPKASLPWTDLSGHRMTCNGRMRIECVRRRAACFFNHTCKSRTYTITMPRLPSNFNEFHRVDVGVLLLE